MALGYMLGYIFCNPWPVCTPLECMQGASYAALAEAIVEGFKERLPEFYGDGQLEGRLVPSRVHALAV